jgi:hypothetical protein
MRKTNTTNRLKVQVIASTYGVILGWLPQVSCTGLLGFFIHRQDHTENESLEGRKSLPKPIRAFRPEHFIPVKTIPYKVFNGPTYAAKPNHQYTYTVTALKGSPKKLTQFQKTSVKVTTESPETGDHDI